MDREDKNINSAVRVSRVENLDESKLVFKIIVGISKYELHHGNYSFNLPPITDLCNSNQYNQAIIKLDQVVINPFSALIGGVAEDNDRPLWTDALTGPGAMAPFNNSAEAFSSVILVLGIPSRQTGLTASNLSNNTTQTGQTYYRYSELVPCIWQFRGNYQGLLPPNNIIAVVNGNQYCISHEPNHSGVLCANPFGSNIIFNFKNPYDVGGDQLNLYLADNADMTLPRDDITDITLQLTITLVPNN